MTWGEFKAWMEDHGVQDSDKVSYIDFSDYPTRVDRYEHQYEPEAGMWVSVE